MKRKLQEKRIIIFPIFIFLILNISCIGQCPTPKILETVKKGHTFIHIRYEQGMSYDLFKIKWRKQGSNWNYQNIEWSKEDIVYHIPVRPNYCPPGPFTTQDIYMPDVIGLYGLDPCSTYEFQMAVVCSNVTSSYSQTYIETTSECNNDYFTTNNYSVGMYPDFGRLNGFKIDDVGVQGLENCSNCNGCPNPYEGYHYFANEKMTLIKGRNVSFEPAGNCPDEYHEMVICDEIPGSDLTNWYFNMWIDYDGNGSFNNTNEKVYSFNETELVYGCVTSSNCKFFTVPSNIGNINTRIRVSFSQGVDAKPNEQFLYGNVWDFPVEIKDEVQEDPCVASDRAALMALYDATNGAGWFHKENWNNSSIPLNQWYGVSTNENGCVTIIDLDGNVDGRTTENVSGNNLTGTLPPEIGNFSSLEYLILYRNKISGGIPDEIYNLLNLKQLTLRTNFFTGSISPNIEKLTELLVLDFAYNDINGIIPPQIGKLSKINAISLTGNKITGKIPPELNKLITLRTLSFSKNKLTGEIPSLASLIFLKNLAISQNNLNGPLPSDIGSLSNLEGLWLYQNHLTGQIPKSLGFLTNLKACYLRDNNLTGCFPELPNICANIDYRANYDGVQMDEENNPIYYYNKDGYSFDENPELAFQGDFQMICNGSASIGAPCDDGNPNTINDKIQSDCSCGTPLAIAPIANFFASTTTGCTPLNVTFTDQSQNNPTSYQWTFEGGTPATSTEQNPTVVFSEKGTHNVSLTVTNSIGSDNVSSTITVNDKPTLDFTNTVSDTEVQFTSMTNGNNISWDFGDGNTSSELNPIHNYALIGTYSVSCTVSNECGETVISKDITLNSSSPPLASFSIEPSEGCTPLNVTFTDQSQNNPTSYQWTFEGGTPATSTEQNPSVVFSEKGTHNVSLTVTNSIGSDNVSSTITVNDKPTLDFTNTVSDTEVQFTSMTSGNNISWDFGDGNTSSELNPIHNYASIGTYSVSCTVSNECGETMISKDITLNSSSPPLAFFSIEPSEGCTPLNVTFTDQSQNNPTSYQWTFEGGTPATSTEQNPFVTFETVGNHAIQLLVSNEFGSDSESSFISVLDKPIVNFAFDIPKEKEVHFTSTIPNGTIVTWDFGDGNTSTEYSPIHIYADFGNFEVTLTITNSCGDSSLQKIVVIVPDCDPTYGVEMDVVNVKCYGALTGEATANPLGGKSPYHYLWSNQVTSKVNMALSSGLYSVTVTDSNDCMTSVSGEISQPMAPLTLSFNKMNESIEGKKDGEISVLVSGGTAPYFYNWSNGETSATITNLGSAIYEVTITDSNDCVISQSTTIAQDQNCEDFINLQLSSSNAPFIDCKITSIDLSVSSDNTDVYSWTLNGQTLSNSTSILSNVEEPGLYKVTATNLETNCSESIDISVLDKRDYPLISFTEPPFPYDCEKKALKIESIIEGVNATDVEVVWNSGESGNFLLIKDAGDYGLIVTNNQSGCTSESSIHIKDFSMNITIDDFTTCDSILQIAALLPNDVIQNISGDWIALDNCEIDPSQNKAKISFHQSGDYEFVWIVSTSCGEIYRDTVLIDYVFSKFKLETDTIMTLRNQDTLTWFNVIQNDDLAELVHWNSQLKYPNDSFQIDSIGNVGFKPPVNFDGDTSFVYYICNSECVNNCQEGKMVFRVTELFPKQDDNGAIPPVVLTPNGDGLNDRLVVPGLDPEDIVEMTVINRWGSTVWFSADYDNDTDYFSGRNMKGDFLVGATYYYIAKVYQEGKFRNVLGTVVLVF